MTVTIINEKKALMREQFLLMYHHRDRWRTIPFVLLLLLFPLPVLFLLGIFVRPDLTASSNFLFALNFTEVWAGLCIFLTLGTIYSHATVMRKTRSVTLSSAGYSLKYWRPEYVAKWSECKGVMCTATDILIFDGAYGFGLDVPLNAFADPREAQRFYETAVGYWQSAKTGQPFTPADATEVWPPAPQLSNSAEPGDAL